VTYVDSASRAAETRHVSRDFHPSGQNRGTHTLFPRPHLFAFSVVYAMLCSWPA